MRKTWMEQMAKNTDREDRPWVVCNCDVGYVVGLRNMLQEHVFGGRGFGKKK